MNLIVVIIIIYITKSNQSQILAYKNYIKLYIYIYKYILLSWIRVQELFLCSKLAIAIQVRLKHPLVP